MSADLRSVTDASSHPMRDDRHDRADGGKMSVFLEGLCGVAYLRLGVRLSAGRLVPVAQPDPLVVLDKVALPS